jgi:hypothetical protein
LRIGATLAMQAAATRTDIEALLLWDPVVSGAELRAEIEQIRAWQQFDPARLREVPMPDVLSFPMTSAMAESLLAINLQALAGQTMPATLLLETAREAHDDFARSARKAGTAIEVRSLDEARIWLREPYEAVVPHQTLNGIVDWMAETTA